MEKQDLLSITAVKMYMEFHDTLRFILFFFLILQGFSRDVKLRQTVEMVLEIYSTVNTLM